MKKILLTAMIIATMISVKAQYKGDDQPLKFNAGGRIGKGISAQAFHRTVLETLTSHGSSHSVVEESTT